MVYRPNHNDRHLSKLKISVITPAFNSASTIADTIESVLGQTYTDFEHLIVDGGSSDGTVDIVRRYQSRYNGRLIFVSEPDNGIYDAMNKGLAMATGDVAGVLNSDDFYSDNSILATIAEAFDDDTDSVFGDLKFVARENTAKVVRMWKGSPYQSFRTGWHPGHPTFYARKSLYSELGGFDTSFRIAADFELMLRFIEKHRIRTRYIDRCMVDMRIGGASTRNIDNIITGNREAIRAFAVNGIPVSVFYPLLRLAPKARHLFTFCLSSLLASFLNKNDQ